MTKKSTISCTFRPRRGPIARCTGLLRTLPGLLMAAVLVSGALEAQFRNPGLAPDFDVRGSRPVTLPEPPGALPGPQSRALQALRRESPADRVEILWSGLTGAPSRIHARGRPIVAAQNASPRGIAMSFLNRYRRLLGLSSQDIQEIVFSRDYTTERNGVTHLTLQQQAFGIDVYGGGLKVNLTFRGEIINVSGEPIPNIHSAVNTTSPQLTEDQAIQAAARSTSRFNAASADVSGLVLFPTSARDARLAWLLTFEVDETEHLYEAVVDAVDGQLLFRRSLTHYNHIAAHGEVYDDDSPIPYTPNETPPASISRVDRAFDGGSFFPHDDPHFDWWATNPRTTTTSNNVDAYADRDGDNAADAGSRPTAGAGEDFTFPVDLTQAPSSYQDASVANLFWWNNRMHDFFYRLGFDEQAGNFQTDNFGLGGSGGDAVRAETQDNAAPADPDDDPSLCNANMNTPGADGGAPRMQMFECDRASPNRDSSFDAVVIAHEYTHGVHTRLVPTTGNQRANEGWSDYFGLSAVAEPGDPYDGSYGVGNYLFSNSGIRTNPYSTRLDVYLRRYADISDSGSCQLGVCSSDPTESCGSDNDCSTDGDDCNKPACDFHEDCQPPASDLNLGICTTSVHRTGEIWANALWIARQHLIAKHGFAAGDRRMNQLVIDGMKLSPNDPTFLDGRDAILAADQVNHGGAHSCLIWDAFAKMGMGLSALTTGVNDINPFEAFDMPAECSPRLQLDSDTEFGGICLADTSATSLKIFNQGSGDLIVSDISRVSGSSDITLEATPSMPVFIGASSHVDFTVRCEPSSGGTKTATFEITSNDGNSPHDVTYTCTGGEPEITTVLNDDFGDVCLADSATRELRIGNPGSCDLTVDNITSSNSEFSIAEVMNFPLSVSPGGEITVPIEFSPTGDFGAESGQISISHDGANTFSPKTLSVNGNSPSGSLNTALANEGAFGNVCKADHADLSLTLFNQGKCDLTIDSVAIEPGGSPFELPADTTFPLVLSPDADFNLPVRYSPEICNDGLDEATVVITTDDPANEMRQIGISGTSSCPNLVIDPAGLENLFSFPATVVDGDQSLGCYSDATVALRNNGGCPLTIDNISAAGLGNALDFGVTAPSQFPIVLPPGEETLGVNVRFTPQADADPLSPSEVTGELTIESDDPDAAGTAPLCGESAAQSGVRMLVADVTSGTPLVVDPVERVEIQSKGINRPGPIKLTFDNAPMQTATVCGNTIGYHVNQETLPSTDTAGGNNSSYQAKAKEGNLQTGETFTLGQCELRDFQLQLQSSDGGDPPSCALLEKGAACSNDGECCSGKCRGPEGGKTCK